MTGGEKKKKKVSAAPVSKKSKKGTHQRNPIQLA